MLNRTNRTLSAATNGLNLGTRTFAAALRADLNLVDLAVLRPGHPQRIVDAFVRDGSIRGSVPIPISMAEPMPSHPPCSPCDPWHPFGSVPVADRRGVVVEVKRSSRGLASKRQESFGGQGSGRGRDSARFSRQAYLGDCASRSYPAERLIFALAPGLNPASARPASYPAARIRAGGG